MIIKGITDEDFVNYKIPSMYIATATCSFKCDRECGQKICQNSELIKAPDIDIGNDRILGRYLKNEITHAIVFGGLEPFDQLTDLMSFIKYAREMGCDDDIVIYTGYTRDEIWDAIFPYLAPKGFLLDNIVIKWGRYIPNQEPHFDDILGVNLASDNQYAERIS